jgi:hypothetical protein
MKRLKLVLSLAALPAFFFWASFATAQQALPTASRTLQLSAFGGLSGDYIGLSGGKNLGITAGVDLGLIPYHGVRPTVEVRGTFPIDDGHIASQKSILFGPRFDFLLNRRLRPYGDFLFGRGEMDYNNGGYIIGNEIFLLTTTNVWAAQGRWPVRALGPIAHALRFGLLQSRHRGSRLPLQLRPPPPLIALVDNYRVDRYRLNSSRSRFVCARLTGISVFFGSSMRSW